MAAEPVLYALDAEGVATITMDDPDTRNALSAEMLSGLLGAFERARDEDGARCVVLASSHEKTFSSGANLGGFAADAPLVQRHFGSERFVSLFKLIGELGKPTIVVAGGHVLAGALGLALACDLIIASEKSKPGAVPALRPNMPCKVGPVRLGPSSSAWQVLHCWLNTRSPRAALPSWAKACVAERPTTIAAAAPAQLFITLLRTLRSMPLHVGRPRMDARGAPCVHARAEPACAGHPSDNPK